MNEHIINRVPLFATLPEAEIQHLAATLQTSDVPPGTLLFRESQPGDGFYIVLEGQI